MNRKFLIAILGMSVLAAGCSQSSSMRKDRIYEVRTTKVDNHGVAVMPVMADLVVDSERSFTKLKAPNGMLTSLDDLKRKATGKLLVTSGADVVIGPQYIITKERDTIEVAVRGYLGRYNNFRNATLGDLTGPSSKRTLVTAVRPETVVSSAVSTVEKVNRVIPNPNRLMARFALPNCVDSGDANCSNAKDASDIVAFELAYVRELYSTSDGLSFGLGLDLSFGLYEEGKLEILDLDIGTNSQQFAAMVMAYAFVPIGPVELQVGLGMGYSRISSEPSTDGLEDDQVEFLETYAAGFLDDLSSTNSTFTALKSNFGFVYHLSPSFGIGVELTYLYHGEGGFEMGSDDSEGEDSDSSQDARSDFRAGLGLQASF